MDYLNPVRVLSIGLIFLKHSNLVIASISPILNYEDVLPSINHLYFTVILSGSFPVDTFFG